MPGTSAKRVSRFPSPLWLRKVSAELRTRIDAEADAGVESAAAIFRRWNVCRFCSARSFRMYVAGRRACVRRYEAARRKERIAAERDAGVMKYAEGCN